MHKTKFTVSYQNNYYGIIKHDNSFLNSELRPTPVPTHIFESEKNHLKFKNKYVAYEYAQFNLSKSINDQNIVIVQDGIIFVSEFQKNLERNLHSYYFNEFTQLPTDTDLDMQINSKIKYLLKFNKPRYEKLISGEI